MKTPIKRFLDNWQQYHCLLEGYYLVWNQSLQKGVFVSVRSTVVEWVTQMLMHSSSSPTIIDHRKDWYMPRAVLYMM